MGDLTGCQNRIIIKVHSLLQIDCHPERANCITRIKQQKFDGKIRVNNGIIWIDKIVTVPTIVIT